MQGNWILTRWEEQDGPFTESHPYDPLADNYLGADILEISPDNIIHHSYEQDFGQYADSFFYTRQGELCILEYEEEGDFYADTMTCSVTSGQLVFEYEVIDYEEIGFDEVVVDTFVYRDFYSSYSGTIPPESWLNGGI